MRQNVFFGVALVMAVSLLGACDKFGQNEYNASEKNALVIKPALGTKVDNGVQKEDGTFVYYIKAMSVGGGVVFPDIGTSFICDFYPEKILTEWPDLSKSLVSISGIRPRGKNETQPGEFIHWIIFRVADFEALGWEQYYFGIGMKDGKYTGDNPFIADVKVKSFKYVLSSGDPKETDINIVITTKKGDVITLRYANDVAVPDGLYY